GRDPLCDLVLRAGGVSRRHAEIELGDELILRDLKSRNGTLVGGLPIAGGVPLRDRGAFALGEDCELEFEVDGAPPVITLRIASGLDRGTRLRAARAGQPLALSDLLDAPARLWFRDGRPLLAAETDDGLLLNGTRIAVGEVQLVHGDELL